MHHKRKQRFDIAQALYDHKQKIIDANAIDMAEAKKNGMSAALMDRLALILRIDGIAEGVRQVAALEDPIGRG